MKWQDYYKIEDEWIEDGDIGSHYESRLILIATGEIVGKYKDTKYAEKQAKYKFKKILAKLEKILLG